MKGQNWIFGFVESIEPKLCYVGMKFWKRPFRPLKPLKPLDLRGPRSPLPLEPLDLGALKEPSTLGPLAFGFWERQTFESPS